jgi:hypothetical protein
MRYTSTNNSGYPVENQEQIALYNRKKSVHFIAFKLNCPRRISFLSNGQNRKTKKASIFIAITL